MSRIAHKTVTAIILMIILSSLIGAQPPSWETPKDYSSSEQPAGISSTNNEIESNCPGLQQPQCGYGFMATCNPQTCTCGCAKINTLEPIDHITVSPDNYGVHIGFRVNGVPPSALMTVRGGIEGSNEEIFKKTKTAEEINAASNEVGLTKYMQRPGLTPSTSNTFDFLLGPGNYWFEIFSDQTEYHSGAQIISIFNPLYLGHFGVYPNVDFQSLPESASHNADLYSQIEEDNAASIDEAQQKKRQAMEALNIVAENKLNALRCSTMISQI